MICVPGMPRVDFWIRLEAGLATKPWEPAEQGELPRDGGRRRNVNNHGERAENGEPRDVCHNGVDLASPACLGVCVVNAELAVYAYEPVRNVLPRRHERRCTPPRRCVATLVQVDSSFTSYTHSVSSQQNRPRPGPTATDASVHRVRHA